MAMPVTVPRAVFTVAVALAVAFGSFRLAVIVPLAVEIPAPAVIVTLPRAVVPLAMLIALRSVKLVPVVPPAPPLSTTLLKSLVAVVSVASANGVIVAVPVEVITPKVG